MTANEPTQVDTRFPLEIEVMREMSFPKRFKIAGLDELSPSSFKDGGEVLTLELTK